MSGWQKVNSSSSSTSSKTRLSSRSRSGISSDDRPSYSRTVRLGRVEPQAPTDRTIYCNDRDSNLSFGFMENLSYVIYVIMSTFYFYLNLILVPVAALLGDDVIYQGIQRWFLPYNYQIVQEIYRHEPDESTREGALHASQSLNLLARLRNTQGLRSTCWSLV